MSDYSDFTKLVLARMESNPEEYEANGRWDSLVRGLEEYARSETDGRYAKTLWALEHQEIEVLLTKYRRMYLDRLHKDMLKNIVSGDDKESYDIARDRAYKTGLGRAIPQTKQQVMGEINHAFDREYASGLTDSNAIYNTGVKGEGTPVNRYSLNASQLAICKKMGMDPGEYARQLGKHGL